MQFLSAKHLYVSKFPHARTYARTYVRAHERPLYSNFKTVRSEQLNATITRNLLLAQFFFHICCNLGTDPAPPPVGLEATRNIRK